MDSKVGKERKMGHPPYILCTCDVLYMEYTMYASYPQEAYCTPLLQRETAATTDIPCRTREVLKSKENCAHRMQP